MSPRDHEFRQRLISGVRILSKLVRALDEGSTKGNDVMRNVAKSLSRSADAHGYPQLMAASVPFANAPDSDLPMLARRLLRVMEMTAAAGWDVKHRILLVDEDKELAETLAVRLAAPTREVLHAGSVKEAWTLIDAQDVALIVLDLVLPDADGRNLLSKLRSDLRTSAIPIVVLSDWGGHELRAECFALGADHFFQKSGDLDLLAIAVASTLHRSMAQVRDSLHDAVTQLLSREGLRGKYTRILERAQEKEADTTLVALDVDLSKASGAEPEELLHGLVREIRRVLRPTDVVARWNEAELILLLSKTNRDGAYRVLERIREALEDRPLRQGSVAFRPEFAEAVVPVHSGMALEAAVAEADRILFSERYVRRAAELPGVGGGRPRVLVADADSETIFGARKAFEAEGFEVQLVCTGRELLKAASAGRVDLILLDVKLPDQSGLEVIRRLRAIPRHMRTPILMTSTMGRDSDSVRAFEVGVDDYVFKPCTTSALVARMRRLLKRAGPPSSGPFKVIRKVGAMAGLFAGDQLFELVQMLGLNRKTGRLVLSSDAYSGNVDFLQGVITKAWTTRGKEGPAACEELLDLEVGRFEFWPGNDVLSSSGEMLHLSVDNLLLDAMRRKDESGFGIA